MLVKSITNSEELVKEFSRVKALVGGTFIRVSLPPLLTRGLLHFHAPIYFAYIDRAAAISSVPFIIALAS